MTLIQSRLPLSVPTFSPLARVSPSVLVVCALPFTGGLPHLAAALFLTLALLVPCRTEAETVRAVLLLSVAGVFAASSVGGLQTCGAEWPLTAGSLYLMGLVILIKRR